MMTVTICWQPSNTKSERRRVLYDGSHGGILHKEVKNDVDLGCLLSSHMASGAVDDVHSGYAMCVPTS